MVTERRKKWERGLEQGLRNFAKQAEQPLAFTIIPVSCIDDMMKAANAGDQDARSGIIAFTNWSSAAEKAMANGVLPACVVCMKELAPVSDGGDGIGGWAQIIPVKSIGTGIVAPICTECIKHPHQELQDKVFDALEEEIGVRAMMVQ